MSNVLKRATAMVAVMMALAFVTTALAQMPTSPWKKGAPFPEPDEELYGVTTNGKLYVFGGWADGKAAGLTYEYDPVPTNGRRRRRSAAGDHAALAVERKIDVMGGSSPQSTAIPVGGAWNRSTTSWKTTRRRIPGDAAGVPGSVAPRSPRKSAATRDRRRHHHGRCQGPVLHVLRTFAGAQHQRR